jgi:tRNA (cmo5U34)-methyltransferase
MSATAAFSAHAPAYTALRRRLVPGFDGFYGAVIEVLGLLERPPQRVLDLGAGTGLLSALVADAFPGVRIDLLDGSEAMLSEARDRLGAAAGEVHVADMAAELPSGPYDALVSALAIHHLEDGDKRALFARVRRALRPGGAFVNAEQVAGPTPQLTEVYERMWARDCTALGATAAELDGARERMRHDRCTGTETQLRWMREAGLRDVDCVHKSWRFAVLVGFA